MNQITNKQAAKIDAFIFDTVFSRIPEASKKTTYTATKKDCIGEHIILVGLGKRINCEIIGIYAAGKCFELRSDTGERHNLFVKSVYSKKQLKNEIKVII